jgi:hypothetical protein
MPGFAPMAPTNVNALPTRRLADLQGAFRSGHQAPRLKPG